MKKLMTISLVCLFALGLATTACDNPLSDAIDDLKNLNCDTTAAQDCQSDLTECVEVIDTASDTADAEQTACEDDYCDCIEDANCDEWVSNSTCG